MKISLYQKKMFRIQRGNQSLALRELSLLSPNACPFAELKLAQRHFPATLETPAGEVGPAFAATLQNPPILLFLLKVCTTCLSRV